MGVILPFTAEQKWIKIFSKRTSPTSHAGHQDNVDSSVQFQYSIASLILIQNKLKMHRQIYSQHNLLIADIIEFIIYLYNLCVFQIKFPPSLSLPSMSFRQ